jgi:hypothetical protein
MLSPQQTNAEMIISCRQRSRDSISPFRQRDPPKCRRPLCRRHRYLPLSMAPCQSCAAPFTNQCRNEYLLPPTEPRLTITAPTPRPAYVPSPLCRRHRYPPLSTAARQPSSPPPLAFDTGIYRSSRLPLPQSEYCRHLQPRTTYPRSYATCLCAVAFLRSRHHR